MRAARRTAGDVATDLGVTAGADVRQANTTSGLSGTERAVLDVVEPADQGHVGVNTCSADVLCRKPSVDGVWKPRLLPAGAVSAPTGLPPQRSHN